MQTAIETATAGFADLICSDPDWVEAEFAALVARSRLEPPVRVGVSGPRPSGPKFPESAWPRRWSPEQRRRLPAWRIRAVARCPPTRQRSARNRTPR